MMSFHTLHINTSPLGFPMLWFFSPDVQSSVAVQQAVDILLMAHASGKSVWQPCWYLVTTTTAFFLHNHMKPQVCKCVGSTTEPGDRDKTAEVADGWKTIRVLTHSIQITDGRGCLQRSADLTEWLIGGRATGWTGTVVFGFPGGACIEAGLASPTQSRVGVEGWVWGICHVSCRCKMIICKWTLE